MKTTGIEITIEFHEDSPPDFAMMKGHGWVHPPGLVDGEYLVNSLIKIIDGCEVHVIRRPFGPRSSKNVYLVVFDGESSGKPRRLGTGEVFGLSEVLDIVRKFSEEIDVMQKEMDF